MGQIRRMDKYSGQAQIVYKEDGQEFLYWAHLNNPSEIAPFMTKAAETIALQQKLNEIELNDAPQQTESANKDNEHGDNVGNDNDGGNDDEEDEEDEEQINISANTVNINPLYSQQQQQHAQQTFIAPPKRSSANTMNNTEHSSRYNSAIPSNLTMSNQHHPNPEQQLFNLQHDAVAVAVQPPPANNMDAAHTQHRKTRSRVLPRSLKNKKLPPKPQKNPNKKRMNQQRMNNMPMPPPMQQTTNFTDLNFNAGHGQNNYAQQHPPPKNGTSANFQHGQTMYTAQW